MFPPLGSNFYVTTPFKDTIYPQLGEVGHIVDSRIIEQLDRVIEYFFDLLIVGEASISL